MPSTVTSTTEKMTRKCCCNGKETVVQSIELESLGQGGGVEGTTTKLGREFRRSPAPSPEARRTVNILKDGKEIEKKMTQREGMIQD